MVRRVKFLFVIIFMGGINVFAGGQEILQRITEPDAVGGSFVATHQDGLGDVLAVGPGLELFLKYNISSKIFVSAGTGIFSATDNTFKADMVKTSILPTIELKAGYNLTEVNKLSPFMFAGLQAAGYKASSKPRVYDGGVLVGAGINYIYNEQLSFHASGDYRYFFTATGDSKPQFWLAKAGVTYKIPRGRRSKREEMEYPFSDQEELVLDELFNEGKAGGKSTTEEDALSLLFSPEKAEGAIGLEEDELAGLEEGAYESPEVRQLITSIRKMRNNIETRLSQIETLQERVSENEKVIAGITGREASKYTSYEGGSFGIVSPEKFKNNYEVGLKKFYVKKYEDAIRIFNELLSSNPDHRLASNCQYWIGESYNAKGDYRKAIEAFNAVMRYRSSHKFDDALLMSGLCHLKLGDRVTARENFQELMTRYPDSEYAPKAMRYLGRL